MINYTAFALPCFRLVEKAQCRCSKRQPNRIQEDENGMKKYPGTVYLTLSLKSRLTSNIPHCCTSRTLSYQSCMHFIYIYAIVENINVG